ncbi:hypothetical protein [Magnetospirillum sp. UT-4]|uniref:hypothetical protein n=1 Tax=Magnetospirillum sp. UT-4 TaxID=2681467 RepID=UPI0013811411|nr:hypothetical protein [Magnetospirillum sp. UT-4]CAA7614979.1 hypothetical protein MTBUT4_20016 [Magnetospirillum sp. UT-4]
MYVVTLSNGRPLVIEDREVPTEPRTACERMLIEFLAENAVHWKSRFPLLNIEDGK